MLCVSVCDLVQHPHIPVTTENPCSRSSVNYPFHILRNRVWASVRYETVCPTSLLVYDKAMHVVCISPWIIYPSTRWSFVKSRNAVTIWLDNLLSDCNGWIGDGLYHIIHKWANLFSFAWCNSRSTNSFGLENDVPYALTNALNIEGYSWTDQTWIFADIDLYFIQQSRDWNEQTEKTAFLWEC